MEWNILSEQPLYQDEWLDIRVADVQLPDGRHLARRLIRTPPGAGVVALNSQQEVLLLWRHRFITRTWGWEIPFGKIEDGETPAAAAAREFEEETGWRAGPLRHMMTLHPTPGLSDSEHHVFRADGAELIGDPTDGIESAQVAWVPLASLRSLIGRGEITSGSTAAALLYLICDSRSGSPAPG